MSARFNRLRLWLCARGVHLAQQSETLSGLQCGFCARVHRPGLATFLGELSAVLLAGFCWMVVALTCALFLPIRADEIDPDSATRWIAMVAFVLAIMNRPKR